MISVCLIVLLRLGLTTPDLSSDLAPVSVTMPYTAPVTTTTTVGFSGQPVVSTPPLSVHAPPFEPFTALASMTGVPFSAASPAVCSAPPARVPSNVPFGSLLTAPSTTSSAPMLTVTPSTAAMPSTAVVRTPAVAVQTVPNVVGIPTSVVGHHQSFAGGRVVDPVPTPDAASPDPLTVALLAQQLPSLPNYNGDNMEGDGESFSDWFERLELVATTCRWDNQTKLVNVATRLRGTVSRYYQSCTPQQRSSYDELVRAQQSRFTPVRIQSVQSSIFHERKQKDGESVDDYAQDLRKLFHRAYSSTRGGGETEAMGRSVLSNQFVAGLIDNIKAKIVGRTGTFEELLAQARFEAARQKNLPHSTRGASQLQNKGGSVAAKPSGREAQCTRQTQRFPRNTNACFSCGGTGHFARDCPLKGRGAPSEARGKSGSSKSSKSRGVSMLRAGMEPGTRKTNHSRYQERDVLASDEVVDDAVSQVVARMHGIEADQTPLGTIPTSEVEVEGLTTRALLLSSEYYLTWVLPPSSLSQEDR